MRPSSKGGGATAGVCRYLVDEAKDKSHHSIDPSQWTLYDLLVAAQLLHCVARVSMQPVARLATAACRRVDAYYPQQLNDYDCGLFMLLGALHVVLGLETEITLSHWQSHMAQFRRHVAACVLEGRLPAQS